MAKAKKISVEPLDDRVVVKRVDAEEMTAGGIVLPDAAQEKPQKGEVIAVGPGRLLDSGERATLDVDVGDMVLFGKYSGTDIKVADEDHMILRESDILAKFE
jgi:chaperonin GroES